MASTRLYKSSADLAKFSPRALLRAESELSLHSRMWEARGSIDSCFADFRAVPMKVTFAMALPSSAHQHSTFLLYNGGVGVEAPAKPTVERTRYDTPQENCTPPLQILR